MNGLETQWPINDKEYVCNRVKYERFVPENR